MSETRQQCPTCGGSAFGCKTCDGLGYVLEAPFNLVGALKEIAGDATQRPLHQAANELADRVTSAMIEGGKPDHTRRFKQDLLVDGTEVLEIKDRTEDDNFLQVARVVAGVQIDVKIVDRATPIEIARRENRRKILMVGVCDLLSLLTTTEHIIDLPPIVSFEGCMFDFNWQCFALLLCSPDFPTVAEGCEIERFMGTSLTTRE